MVLQNGRERPDQAGADRLSAEPAEPEGERHRAPHVGLELDRLEGHLQARQTGRRVTPECEPRFVTLIKTVSRPAWAPSARSSATSRSRSAAAGNRPKR